MSFNDILEVLRDLSGSFMSDEQREVLTRIQHCPFLFRFVSSFEVLDVVEKEMNCS